MSEAKVSGEPGGFAAICSKCGEPMYVSSISASNPPVSTWGCASCDPSSAVPLETMIEEMGGVDIVKADRGWFAMPTDLLGNRPLDWGWPANAEPTVYEAVSALYAAWRERRNDG